MPPPRSRDRVLDLPTKASRVLGLLLLCFLLIGARVWYLAVLQHDKKVGEARRPQTKRVWESAERGTICDRFHVPLAVNRVQYNAAVCYADIREVPRWVWEVDASGHRQKCFKRREHIRDLAVLLAGELDLDADRVEDLIYSKASLFQHLPYTLKENISEETYYRFRLMEKDWPGLVVMRVPQRHYPLGPVAGHALGYMGAINAAEYEGVLGEIRALEAYIEQLDAGFQPPLPENVSSSEEAFTRLQQLKDQAYTVNDTVGKTGLEGFFEGHLRGYKGQKFYYSDARGNFLRELPGGKEPLSGQQLTLALSSELQAFTEELLIQNEAIREGRSTRRNRETGGIEVLRQPWIKGGAVVALDPRSGEVLALASCPRFDPNDFVPSGDPVLDQEKRARVQRWLESESYLGAIWDQHRPLEREVWKEGGIVEESQTLDWEGFLDFVLPEENPVRVKLRERPTVGQAVRAHQAWSELMGLGGEARSSALVNFLFGSASGHGQVRDKGLSRRQRAELEEALMANEDRLEELRRDLEPVMAGLSHNYDKILLLDLYRLATGEEGWTPDMLGYVGDWTLREHRDLSAAMTTLRQVVWEMAVQAFHSGPFKAWRDENQRDFLKDIRHQERVAGQYQRPYLDYLDKEEKRQFQLFWEQHGRELLQVFLMGIPDGDKHDSDAFLRDFGLWYEELAQGAHSQLPWYPKWRQVSAALDALPREQAGAYLATLRGFSDLKGTLWGFYPSLRREQGKQLEKHLAMAFYPTYGYGFGRSHAYRQGVAQGSIFKLVTGYAALIERYQELLERGESLKKLNPLEMVDQPHRVTPGKRQWNLGYFLDGRPIPQQYNGGRLVPSVSRRIGAVDLPRALEHSSNPYFALLAADCIREPRSLLSAAKDFSYGSPTGIDLTGEFSGRLPNDLEFNRSGLYEFAIGQHSLVSTPLQTAVMLATLGNGGAVYRPNMLHEIQASVPVRGSDTLYPMVDPPYEEYLGLLGVDYPLFLKSEQEATQTRVQPVPPDLRRELYMPKEVRTMLLEGMRRAALRCQTRSIYGLYDYYQSAPEGPRALQDLKGQLLGKSSTTEARESVDLDRRSGSNIYNHIWWGGLLVNHPVQADEEVSEDDMELVVVVYLRYGGYGSEAAPIAAQVAQKWREIKGRQSL